MHKIFNSLNFRSFTTGSENSLQVGIKNLHGFELSLVLDYCRTLQNANFKQDNAFHI